jgi:hypothetical protein
MVDMPTRKYMTTTEALAFIRENYASIEYHQLIKKIQRGYFTQKKLPNGRSLIDVQSIIGYFEGEPTVEHDFSGGVAA